MEKVKSEDRLLESIIAGAQKVINGKDELNKINVFPVADGDTGSNLASLMQTIIDNLSNNNYSTNLLFDEVAYGSAHWGSGKFWNYFCPVLKCRFRLL